MIQSNFELQNGITRPIPLDEVGHAFSDVTDAPYPYSLFLVGEESSTSSELEQDSRFRLLPERSEDGIIFDSIYYSTASEAMRVGNAFPAHRVYTDWIERTSDFINQPAAGPMSLSRAALTGVHLYFHESYNETFAQTENFDQNRLKASPLRPNLSKYTFAEGDNKAPLIEITRTFELLPSELPRLDPTKISECIENLSSDIAAMQVNGYDADAYRQQMSGQFAQIQLERGHAEGASNEAEVRIARRLASDLARARAGDSGTSEEIDAIMGDILEELYGTSLARELLK